tara:strand:+ start:839 stop:2350 length:1512 start_codon:yes stop_codon:yes gene_type:complete
MNKVTYLSLFFFIISNVVPSQSIDDSFSQKRMLKDLEVFKEIRVKANSGLYKYRTKEQIDSIYNWAENQIAKSSTYRDFYNIISQLTDFEGSLHNGTFWSDKQWKSIKNESYGYFPIPLKFIEGKLLVNTKGNDIPLGSEIISINGNSKKKLLTELGKYYTTDGFNITGKKLGISGYFSKYYRYNYGLKNEFKVIYKSTKTEKLQTITLESVSYKKFTKNFQIRHSRKIDRQLYDDIVESEYYSINKVDSTTAILTINSFSLGSNNDKSHIKYKQFLDSVFKSLNQKKIKNLIIDVRNNGGGNKPNDMITLSYLANSPQKEIKSAWIGFTNSIPYWKYFKIDIPFYLKPFAKGKLKKIMKQQLPIVKNNRRYYKNIETYQPNKNRFKGQVYLLVGPKVASIASLFSSMLASNTNTIIIGEETSGGYYGHNGSFPVQYKLPKSDFFTDFSIVNLTQDVIKKETQLFGRGIIPKFKVEHSFEDFLNNNDTQMNFTIELINKKKTE